MSVSRDRCDELKELGKRKGKERKAKRKKNKKIKNDGPAKSRRGDKRKEGRIEGRKVK